MASLFKACKDAVRNGEGGTFNIGGTDIVLEYYTQDHITSGATIGNSNVNNIVCFFGDTITIPSGKTIIPSSCKKSLVFFCNNFVNNGTISMIARCPNIKPHNLFLIEGAYVNSSSNIIIPAYANNKIARYQIASSSDTRIQNGKNGNNGTNRNCGSGGQGCCVSNAYVYSADTPCYMGASGSGTAFGGGAGSGGTFGYYRVSAPDVDTTYPMRGGNGANHNTWVYNCGGVGNPPGTSYGSNSYVITDYTNNTGCGGRIIIFCSSFTNNGTITVNGTATKQPPTISKNGANLGLGAASGAGAVDIFYTTLVKRGTINANGGGTYSVTYEGKTGTPGKGGNGSITLTQWFEKKVIKEERKIMTRSNWIYLFNNYTERLREDAI